MGRELACWRRILLEAPLYGLLLLTLLAGLAAYQVQIPQFIDVGGIHDAPYLSSFHEPEPDRRKVPNPEVDFRWTRGRVGIDLLGVGRQPVEVRLRMQASRPGNIPQPTASLWAGGQRLFLTTVGPAWQVYAVLLPPDLLAAGDLQLELQSETFRPYNDQRDLGVSLDWVEARPAGVGWIEPAWAQVGCLAGVAFFSYLLLRRLGLGRWWTAGLAAVGSGLLAYLLAYHPLSLTYFSVALVALLGTGVLLTALMLPLLEQRWTRTDGGGPVSVGAHRRMLLPRRTSAGLREPRLLWALLLLGFLLRLGGMLYPQFRSSDLMLHIHNAEFVRTGNLFFTELLPDLNLPAPYPPGLYVSFLPLTLFSNNLPLLMEIAGAALDVLAGLLLYLLARRLSGRGDVALLALLLQQAAPVTYLIFAWGNYANMFSRVTLLATLVLLALLDWRRARLRQWTWLGGAFVLVLLSHFADSLLFGAFVLAVVALGLLWQEGRHAAPRVFGALLLAGALVLGLYYSAPAIWGPLRVLLEALLSGQGRPGVLVNPLENFLRDVQAPLALLVLPGLALLPLPKRRWPAAILAAVLLVALVFALGQAFFGFSSRYSFFVLPVLALGTGMVLAMLYRRGWAGRLAVGLLLGYLVWNCLYTWWWAIGFYLR